MVNRTAVWDGSLPLFVVRSERREVVVIVRMSEWSSLPW